MRTKLAFLIGILALMVFTVSAASAETTFYLTDTNVNRDSPDTVPAGEINISVTYDDTNITVESIGNVQHPDIKVIAYNLSTSDGITIIDSGTSSVEWAYDTGDFQEDGFGRFITECTQTSSVKTGGPITIPLGMSFDENIPDNDDGYEIVVHISFDAIPDGDGGYIKDPEDSDKYLTSLFVSGHIPDNGNIVPSGDIPEFPTIALPVAAIMGIMFLFGRRKTE